MINKNNKKKMQNIFIDFNVSFKNIYKIYFSQICYLINKSVLITTIRKILLKKDLLKYNQISFPSFISKSF